MVEQEWFGFDFIAGFNGRNRDDEACQIPRNAARQTLGHRSSFRQSPRLRQAAEAATKRNRLRRTQGLPRGDVVLQIAALLRQCLLRSVRREVDRAGVESGLVARYRDFDFRGLG